jgi:predicted restriction endonuclease
MSRRIWTRNELIVAFNLYCKLRFGQCHGRHPEVVQLAQVLNRTPNAVAMKLCNFAAFDPAHQSRGIAGLSNTSRGDRVIWEEFNSDWNRLAIESEMAVQNLLGKRIEESTEENDGEVPAEPAQDNRDKPRTETQRMQTIRLGQSFFRSTVLASYNDRCCVCLLPCRTLLIASHIIPWAIRPQLRLDPRNGLCLCAMHDKAFDRGLLSIDSDNRVLISRQIESGMTHSVMASMFAAFRGKLIHLPEKFRPDPEHFRYHRCNIFREV